MDSWNNNYHYLIDAVPKGIQVINRQGILVDANRAWLIYFGVTLGDVKGRHIRDVMQDMVFANAAAIGPDAPTTEYSSPAALETLKTGLPYSNTFNNERMLAVSRPVYTPRGQFDYVMTTISENTGGPQLTQATTPPPALEQSSAKAAPLIIGKSPALAALRRTIARVAPSGASILICGETGTGKEIFANEIHYLSGRNTETLIRVNCAAIPNELIESELFGYERGAFTGALASGKAGLIEAAEGGTLLLDEINALPLAQQGKLLRVLESRAVQRVGGLKEKPVNFRLLSATNVDLEKMVAEHTFREDLYYRLNVIQLRIPPLRERREDIIPIMQYYLDFFGQQYQRVLTLSPLAARQLMEYEWPGNVRELRNMAEYLVITVEQHEILPEHLTLRRRQAGSGGEAAKRPSQEETASPSPVPQKQRFDDDFSLKSYLDQCEREILDEAFRQFGSSRRVAEVLKIDQSSAVRKKGKYGL
jgi:transcriptional regulator with PAS, ATPase and Fis domain